jgi:CspA family cold shock protein
MTGVADETAIQLKSAETCHRFGSHVTKNQKRHRNRATAISFVVVSRYNAGVTTIRDEQRNDVGLDVLRSFFPSRRILRSCAFPISACLDAVAIFAPRFWADGLLRQEWSCAPTFQIFVCWRAGMPQGTIKKLVADRGFGFIKGERDEMFFHHSEVKGATMEELHEGQQVEYQIGQGKKGPCAVSVRVV